MVEFKEFGIVGNPIIVMIHAFCTPWELWNTYVSFLEKDYHIIIPILEGHNRDNMTSFSSVDNNAEQVINYIKKYGNEIFAIIGASLGGAVTISILSKKKLKIQRAIIDAGITPNSYNHLHEKTIVYRDTLMTMLGRKGMKYLELKYPSKLYTMEGSSQMYNILRTISNKTIHNVYYSVDTYPMPDGMVDIDTQIEYWYGGEEEKERKISSEYVKNKFKNVNVRVFNGFSHIQMWIAAPQLYEKEMKATLAIK